MTIQLNPPIWVETPLGSGRAIFFRDDGEDFYWTVALTRTRAIVQFRNEKIRIANFYTLGRGLSDAEMRKIISQP